MKKMIFVILYCILSFISYKIIDDFTYLFFGWNVILAFIPYVLSLYLENTKKIVFIIIFIICLLFLPNSFYLITDIIHLQDYHYYYSIVDYNYDFKIWVALVDIALGFFIGTYFGLLTLTNLKKIFIKKYHKLSEIFIIGICILSGIGIYIGRFFRFNSWDIIKPFTIIKTFFESINLFTLGFISIITIYIYFTYLLFTKGKDYE